MATGAALATGYAVIALRAAHPLVDPRLLRQHAGLRAAA
jgi:hypothetical protein